MRTPQQGSSPLCGVAAAKRKKTAVVNKNEKMEKTIWEGEIK